MKLVRLIVFIIMKNTFVIWDPIILAKIVQNYITQYNNLACDIPPWCMFSVHLSELRRNSNLYILANLKAGDQNMTIFSHKY